MKAPYLVNINGTLQSPEQARISIFDRGFLFGDSIYEATLCEKGIPLYFEEHAERLHRSAELIGLDLQFNAQFLREQLVKTTSAISFKRGIIRWIVTRGIDELNIFPGENLKQNFIIIYKELAPFPERWFKKGINLKVAKTKRNHSQTTNPKAKTGNYLNSVMAAQEAKKEHFDDSLFLNVYGEIAEGTTNNFWIIKDGELITPSLNSGILDGITRRKVIEVCQKNNVTVKETKVYLKDIETCDEAFICSSTKGVVPVHKIEGRTFESSPGEVTKRVSELYEKDKNSYLNSRSNF